MTTFFPDVLQSGKFTFKGFLYEKEKESPYRSLFFLLIITSSAQAITINKGVIKELDDKSAIVDFGNLLVQNGGINVKNGTLETQGATITEKAGETGYVTLSGSDSLRKSTGTLRLGIIDRPLDFDHIVSQASLEITDGANVITDDFVMGNYNEVRVDNDNPVTLRKILPVRSVLGSRRLLTGKQTYIISLVQNNVYNIFFNSSLFLKSKALKI
ncbi:TPA: hypothetical protein KV183_001528 [Morganella morganii]|nr:hypothetical protein [Morganella morganii]